MVCGAIRLGFELVCVAKPLLYPRKNSAAVGRVYTQRAPLAAVHAVPPPAKPHWSDSTQQLAFTQA